MKLNPLETHDRLKHFTNQDFDINACCQDLINQRPFGNHPFYIFVHSRTFGLDEKLQKFNEDLFKSLTDFSYKRKYKSMEDVPEKKVIWDPRLTKPRAETNSMLFKGYPGTDIIKVYWIIPDEKMWKQYSEGLMLENKTVLDSIYKFINNREELEKKEPEDLDDVTINEIYKEISIEARRRKMMNRIYEQ